MKTKCKYPKLDGKITEVFGTRGAFAKAINLNINTVSRKMNGASSWKNDQMLDACKALGIPDNDISSYFLSNSALISTE